MLRWTSARRLTRLRWAGRAAVNATRNHRARIVQLAIFLTPNCNDISCSVYCSLYLGCFGVSVYMIKLYVIERSATLTDVHIRLKIIVKPAAYLIFRDVCVNWLNYFDS